MFDFFKKLLMALIAFPLAVLASWISHIALSCYYAVIGLPIEIARITWARLNPKRSLITRIALTAGYVIAYTAINLFAFEPIGPSQIMPPIVPVLMLPLIMLSVLGYGLHYVYKRMTDLLNAHAKIIKSPVNHNTAYVKDVMRSKIDNYLSGNSPEINAAIENLLELVILKVLTKEHYFFNRVDDEYCREIGEMLNESLKENGRHTLDSILKAINKLKDPNFDRNAYIARAMYESNLRFNVGVLKSMLEIKLMDIIIPGNYRVINGVQTDLWLSVEMRSAARELVKKLAPLLCNELGEKKYPDEITNKIGTILNAKLKQLDESDQLCMKTMTFFLEKVETGKFTVEDFFKNPNKYICGTDFFLSENRVTFLMEMHQSNSTTAIHQHLLNNSLTDLNVFTIVEGFEGENKKALESIIEKDQKFPKKSGIEEDLAPSNSPIQKHIKSL